MSSPFVKRGIRFRQVHLDFHTSPHIPGIGEKFDKKQWQEALLKGRVNSINTFAKCHHGWSYYETKVGKMHPHLKFDLLRAQYEACKEIDVLVPIYISSGVDNVMAEEHPEWREISIQGCFQGWTGPINRPGFKTLCFNTPYLDYLCEQTMEVARLFPDCDGIWSDIIFQGECCCKWCLEYMKKNDLDPDKSEDRQICANSALERYYKEFTAAARCERSDMPVFHNSGHIAKGRRDLLPHFSHLEIESLPTGGWGYDHFPISAKYCQHLDREYIGMTGKFHTWWGEFGGYKHPNALKYECSLMLAHGAKCCVGDQLHPSGWMDESTYEIIGAAYAEVEQKEPWCSNVTPVADIALISSEAENGSREPDVGASRMLFESHLLFDVIDRQVDFSDYKLIILPDNILVDDQLKSKLEVYLDNGGKLLLTGTSGLRTDGSAFALDIGADFYGESSSLPDYLIAGDALVPSFVKSPIVMKVRSQQIKATVGEVLAEVAPAYFNRTWKHFCSHQHAPVAEKSGYAAAVKNGNILYLAHPVFKLYHAEGAVAHKEYVVNAINLLIGDNRTVETNLPSSARVTLMEQKAHNRYIMHLLYVPLQSRGSNTPLSPEGLVHGGTQIEVIEDFIPLMDIEATLKLPKNIQKVTLEPQGVEIPFEMQNDELSIKIDRLICHQMVVLHY